MKRKKDLLVTKIPDFGARGPAKDTLLRPPTIGGGDKSHSIVLNSFWVSNLKKKKREREREKKEQRIKKKKTEKKEKRIENKPQQGQRQPNPTIQPSFSQNPAERQKKKREKSNWRARLIRQGKKIPSMSLHVKLNRSAN